MTRRSTSISHQSGTTLTLVPPSIRPTERLGGPRTGSGVDRASSPAYSARAETTPGHPVDRVLAQLGRRGVAGDAPGPDLPPDRPLVAVDDVEQRRLGDDRQVGPVAAVGQPDEPVWVNSSSTVQAMTTDAEPAGRSRTSRAKAASIAAIPPLMSHEPRP